MKLSVLIPTYNYVCYRLVQQLHEQLVACGADYEVIVMDDGSFEQVKIIANRKINELEGCRYIYNKENVGRAAIRNKLADIATGEWLLFMDSDAMVVREDFIARFIETAIQGEGVICGGLIHADVCLDPERQLRWRYEISFSKKHGTVSEHFRSSCFMINHHIFDQVRFDESYKSYGYEDVKFGVDLGRKGYKVRVIDNPIQSNYIDKNDEYLHKTEVSLQTLHEHKEDLQETKLLTFISNHRIYSMFIYWIYLIFRNPMRRNLLGANPNMRIFMIYKLGYYISRCE